MNFDQTLHHTRSIFEIIREQPISECTVGCKKILTSFFQCVKVSLFFFRTPVHMHVLTIPLVRDRGYTDGRVKCRKPVEEPGTAPRVRVGNFVALLIERHRSNFSESFSQRLCETVNKRSETSQDKLEGRRRCAFLGVALYAKTDFHEATRK